MSYQEYASLLCTLRPDDFVSGQRRCMTSSSFAVRTAGVRAAAAYLDAEDANSPAAVARHSFCAGRSGSPRVEHGYATLWTT